MINKDLEIELEDMLEEKGRTNLPGDLDSHDDLDHGTTNIPAEGEQVKGSGLNPTGALDHKEAEIKEIMEDKGRVNLPGDATIMDTDVNIEEKLQEKGTTNLPDNERSCSCDCGGHE